MISDRDELTDKDFPAASRESAENQPVWQPSRREVIAGAASLSIISPPLAAQDAVVFVEYGDEARRSLRVGISSLPVRSSFVLPAAAFGNPEGAVASRARFTLSRVETGWLAHIENGCFPGGPTFKADLLIELRTDADAVLTLTFRSGVFGKIALEAPSLSALLQHPDRAFLQSKNANSEVAKLLAALFADSLDTRKARNLALQMTTDSLWFATATNGALIARVPGSAAAEGLFLETPQIAFAVLDVSMGAEAGGDDVRGVEPTIPSALRFVEVKGTPKKTDSAVVLSGQTAHDVRALFEGADGAGERGRTLYALASGSALTGTLTIGAFGPAGKDSARVSAPPAANIADTLVLAAWKRPAVGTPRFALRAPLSLDLACNGRESGRFTSLDGLLWHVPGEGSSALVAELTPTIAGPVRTAYGSFEAAPLPSLAPRPGAKARIAPIVVGGRRVANKPYALTHFAAPLSLRSADPGLEDSPDAFAALRFDEAECLFHIGGVARLRPLGASPAMGAEPPRGQALVDLARPSAGNRAVRLSLDRAHLSLRRACDLLSLNYRFRDLVLEGEANDQDARLRWRITPDRLVAGFVRDRQLPAEPEATPSVCASAPPTPKRLGDPQDVRPLMVVDFPPQHIAEQAYFRQLPVEPALPTPPDGEELTREERDTLLYGVEKDRQGLRMTIAKSQQAAADQDATKNPEGHALPRDRFAAAFKAEAESTPGLPKDQAIYIGPAFLDPQAARLARKVARRLLRSGEPTGPSSTNGEIGYRLRGLPDVDLSQTALEDLRRANGIDADFPEDWTAGAKGAWSATPAAVASYTKAREALKAQRDPDYAEFRTLFLKMTQTAYLGRASALRAVRSLTMGKRDDLLRKYEAVLRRRQDAVAREPIDRFDDRPAEARVSGRSRLAFRISANDYDTGAKDADGRPAGSFPFSVKGLTDWGAFDLDVVRRAEKVFEAPEGREPQRWNRTETLNDAERLLNAGLSRGDRFAIAEDEKLDGCRSPGALGSVTAAQRLAEVVASARDAPRWDQTAIEFPCRLMLSPAQDANWLTPLRLPRSDLVPDSSLAIPLWNARLDEPEGASSLRAVWSPDFRPDALLDPKIGGPPRGPWAPWAMARSIDARHPYAAGTKPELFRTSLDAYDRHELVILSSVHGLPVRGRRRTDGSLADNSQMEPPPGFRLRDAARESLNVGVDPRVPDMTVGDRSAIYRAKPLGVSELTLSALGATFEEDTDFEPPASAKIVAYDSLFGRGGRQPDRNTSDLFAALSVERWRHSAILGRDTKVEIVYKGFLFPLGHRASLVKSTERRFMRRVAGGAPVAALVQRFFLRIGTPEKRYPAIGQPDGGRRWPVETLEILTRVTPDLLDPTEDLEPGLNEPKQIERSRGRIFLRGDDGILLPGLAFWPRVTAGAGGEVQFELQVDKRGARVRLPLIFVDNTMANNANALKLLVDFYNTLGTAQAKTPNDTAAWPWDPDDGSLRDERRRLLEHHGAKRRYAAESEPDDTSFETLLWEVQAEGATTEQALRVGDGKDTRYVFSNASFDFVAVLQGADQPPFFPVLRRALVHIGQIDRLVGSGAVPVTVRFDPQYQAFGFPRGEVLKGSANAREREARNDVYVDFERHVLLNPGSSGDRTGGAARPSSDLVGLSRSRGPIGGEAVTSAPPVSPGPPGAPVADGMAATSTQLEHPDIGKLFNPDAKILGILRFADALHIAQDGLSKTPAFREVTEYGSALLDQAEGAADDAVAKVRDLVLLPLRDALDTLADQFGRSLDVAGRKANFDEAEAALSRLYPQVGVAFGDMHAALSAAIDASGSSSDIGALLQRFAAIYASGRRFLAAVERLARDPISPIQEAVKGAFAEQVNALLGDVDAIKGELVGAVRSLALEAQKAAKTLFVGETLALWRRFVFNLPIPLDEGSADELRTKIDTALTQALAKDAWVAALQRNDLGAAATSLVVDVETALTLSAGDPLKSAADEALRAWRDTAGPDLRIQGILFAPVMHALSDVLTAVDAILKNLERFDLFTIGAKASRIIEAAVKLARPSLTDLGKGADKACGAAAALLVDAVDIVAPRLETAAHFTVGSFKTAMNDFDTAFKDLDQTLADLLALSPPLPTAARITVLKSDADTYRAAVKAAAQGALASAEPIVIAATRFTDLEADLKSKGCSDLVALAKQPLEALNGLLAYRKAFLTKLSDLASALSKTPFTSGEDLMGQVFSIAPGTMNDKIAMLPDSEVRAALEALRIATGRSAALSSLMLRFAAEASALKADLPSEALIATRLSDLKTAALTMEASVVAAGGQGLKSRLSDPIAKIQDVRATLLDKVAVATTKLEGIANTVADGAAEAAIATSAFEIDLVALQAKVAIESVTSIARDLVALETRLLEVVAEVLSAGGAAQAAILGKSIAILRPAVAVLATVQTKILTARNEVYAKLASASPSANDAQDLVSLGAGLGTSVVQQLRMKFIVARPPSVRKILEGSHEKPTPTGPDDDFLAGEKYELDRLVGDLGGATLDSSEATLATAVFADWRNGQASVVILKDQIQLAAEAILSGQLARVVDLQAVRRTIEAKLKEMVPSRVSTSYDFNAELHDFLDIFKPQPGSALTISANASYDLLSPSSPPRFTASATLDAFDINLFDVVTFKFDGAAFSNDSVKGSHFAVAYNDFVLGSKAEFLKPLQSILNPAGSGPYVVATKGFPGIEAGFSLALGVISLGAVSFANLSINAACRLPFDDRQAVFVVSIGRRDKPFLISCLPYTGGGYLALFATSKKMLGFEASFEFGGGGAFKVGPLEGQGRISLGIYVSQVQSADPDGPQGCTIEGFFYAGGEAHIACFSLSASLVVSISQQPGGAMHGSAIFTFSFSLGIADIHYQIAFIKSEGKGFSGSKGSASVPSRTRYAALGDDIGPVPSCSGAILETDAVGIDHDWLKHRSYFTNDIDGFPA